MTKNNLIHTAIPSELVETAKKVLIDCEKLGIFLNKSLSYLIINEKAKRGKMSDLEIKEFIKKLRGIVKN
jgi:hypothetical protein